MTSFNLYYMTNFNLSNLNRNTTFTQLIITTPTHRYSLIDIDSEGLYVWGGMRRDQYLRGIDNLGNLRICPPHQELSQSS